MEGGEVEFLRTVIAAMVKFERPKYVEVGVAYGETLYGVWKAVKGIPYSSVIGIELPTWEAFNCIDGFFKDEPLFKYLDQADAATRATVVKERSTEFFQCDGPHPNIDSISVAFIDACHGKTCVMADFEAVEKHCQIGSVVIFHDAGENEQGSSLQPHCNQTIGVRAALTELGLLDNKRAGWEFRRMIPTENQCAVFEKVS